MFDVGRSTVVLAHVYCSNDYLVLEEGFVRKPRGYYHGTAQYSVREPQLILQRDIQQRVRSVLEARSCRAEAWVQLNRSDMTGQTLVLDSTQTDFAATCFMEYLVVGIDRKVKCVATHGNLVIANM